MKEQIKKLIEKYKAKGSEIEKVIDFREKAGLDCYFHYKEMITNNIAINDLTYLLNFTNTK